MRYGASQNIVFTRTQRARELYNLVDRAEQSAETATLIRAHYLPTRFRDIDLSHVRGVHARVRRARDQTNRAIVARTRSHNTHVITLSINRCVRSAMH